MNSHKSRHISVGFPAVFLNMLVLIVSWRRKKIINPTEFNIIILAAGDLLLALVTFPMMGISSYYHRWVFHDAGIL